MKKNNVAVDIINFGEEGVNTAKLERFQSTINNHDNSHLVTISPGPRLLYEVVASSQYWSRTVDSVLASRVAIWTFGGAGGAGDIIDPNMDPDLAMALRLSLEEEKARQERRPPIELRQKPVRIWKRLMKAKKTITTRTRMSTWKMLNRLYRI